MPKTRIIPSYLVIVARITNKINGIILFEFDDCMYDIYEKIESAKNIVNNNVSIPETACNPNAGINPKNNDIFVRVWFKFLNLITSKIHDFGQQ